MRIFLTGASGFLGTHILNQCIKQNFQLLASTGRAAKILSDKTLTVENISYCLLFVTNKVLELILVSYIRNKSLTTVSSIFDFRGGADYRLRQDITLSFTGRLQAVINETSKEIKLNTSGILMSFRYNF